WAPLAVPPPEAGSQPWNRGTSSRSLHSQTDAPASGTPRVLHVTAHRPCRLPLARSQLHASFALEYAVTAVVRIHNDESIARSITRAGVLQSRHPRSDSGSAERALADIVASALTAPRLARALL